MVVFSKQNKSGMISLMLVIVVGAAVLLMAASASLLGINESQMGYDFQKGGDTLNQTDGCLEEALLRLRQNSGYTGGTLSFTSGSCIITVSGTLPSLTINVVGTFGNYNNKLQATATVSGGTAVLTSWQELTN